MYKVFRGTKDSIGAPVMDAPLATISGAFGLAKVPGEISRVVFEARNGGVVEIEVGRNTFLGKNVDRIYVTR